MFFISIFRKELKGRIKAKSRPIPNQRINIKNANIFFKGTSFIATPIIQ